MIRFTGRKNDPPTVTAYRDNDGKEGDDNNNDGIEITM